MKNIIHKIIANKILGNKIDDHSEMFLQEWISENPKNKETFERIKNVTLAKIIDNKESQNFGEKMSDKVITKINSEKQLKRTRLKIMQFSTAAAAVAAVVITVVIPLINLEQPTNNIANNEPTNKVENLIQNNKVTLITADGSFVNIEKGDTLNSIIKLGYTDKLATTTGITANNTIIVPLKKTFDMVLPDGTKVWLNAGSKFTFPVSFSDTLRSVELVGEAFFEVVKNTNAPFIVKTRDLETKVLGTKFLVTSYNDNSNCEVALVEGRVNVSSIAANRNSILVPGKGISYNSKNNNYKVIDINIDKIRNHKSDVFIFNDITLAEITTSLSRWYGIEFEFSDKQIMNEIFYLKSTKYETIEEVLLLLKYTKKLDYAITKNIIKIKSLLPMS